MTRVKKKEEKKTVQGVILLTFRLLLHTFCNVPTTKMSSGSGAYLFCGEGSRLLSHTCPALGGCMPTVPFEEESSGPESCAGFFYKKRGNKKSRNTAGYESCAPSLTRCQSGISGESIV